MVDSIWCQRHHLSGRSQASVGTHPCFQWCFQIMMIPVMQNWICSRQPNLRMCERVSMCAQAQCNAAQTFIAGAVHTHTRSLSLPPISLSLSPSELSLSRSLALCVSLNISHTTHNTQHTHTHSVTHTQVIIWVLWTIWSVVSRQAQRDVIAGRL